MCRIDYADDWQTIEDAMRQARKDHVCCDCGGAIERGETYHVGKGRSDYGLETYRTCARCSAAAEWLKVTCGGYLYQGIIEELIEHWEEEWTLRNMAFGRLVVAAKRRWINWAGIRIPYSVVVEMTRAAVEALPAEVRTKYVRTP